MDAMKIGKIEQLTESYSSLEAALRGSRKAVVVSKATKLRNEIDQLLSGLPHADRICELWGECTCGRDEIIQKVLEKLQS
jgi:hypothetical protein